MDNPPPPLKALTCDLVMENLASFLPLEDLKSLTLVCSGIKESVRRTNQFSNRTRLRVTQEAIQSGLFVQGVLSPKHVFLELFNNIKLERGLIREVVEGAESLQLGFQQPPLPFHDIRFNHFLSQILTTSKRLRSLELSSSIMYKVSPNLFSKLGAQETLSRLQSFQITADELKVLPESLHEVFRQSFAKISTVPLNLKSFHFGKLSHNCDDEFLSFIPLLIQQIKGTLEELELLEPKIWMSDEMNGITCPNLKRLSISALGSDRSLLTMETFLQNQLPLEEVDINLPLFPRQILEMILRSSPKLKRLRLKAKEFIGEAGTIDWQLLEGMSDLKEFSLVMTNEAFQIPSNPPWKERGENILRWLPPTLQRITLQGFRYFWKRGRNLGRKNVGRLLSRFGNLTQLNLHRCYGAVTDVGLQSMISLCPKLTHLRFSHSYYVTNNGVTGVQYGNWMKTGASLVDLKGLTHLAISYCPNIYPEVLVDGLEFQCLRSLDYFVMVGVTKEVLVLAAQLNPSLERLRMNTNSFSTGDTPLAPADLEALREEVIGANPRIRDLTMEEPYWVTADMDM